MQGAGLSLLFVPLTTVAMDPIPRERMGNATSLFNLMRNIGGSIGIAVTGTMLARNQQATTAMLGRTSAPTTRRRRRCSRRCARRSWPPAPTSSTATNRAYAAMFGMVQRQAAMVSFVGLFQLLGIMFLLLLPLVLLMKRPARGAAPPAGAPLSEEQRARRGLARLHSVVADLQACRGRLPDDDQRRARGARGEAFQ